MRPSTIVFALLLVVAACGAPTQPGPTATTNPTATATTQPTSTANPSTGCAAEPSAAASPGCTQTPAPAVTATPGGSATATPAGTASGDLHLAFGLYVDGLQALTFATNAGDGSNRLFALEQVGTIRIIGIRRHGGRTAVPRHQDAHRIGR